MSDATRVRLDAQPAFVLHSYPYRETSLVLETFTRHHGRVAMVARGAKRPRSALRGVLMAFQPLLLSWAGKNELRTLHKAEWQGGLPQMKGLALLCGFYLNELLVKLLPRDDPHETLFGVYGETLRALCAGQDRAVVLRRFEKKLLGEIGYALTLDQDVKTGAPIEPGCRYHYHIEQGPTAVRGNGEAGGFELQGSTLIDIRNDDYSDPTTMQQSKSLMRILINHHLGQQAVNTRQLLVELQQL